MLLIQDIYEAVLQSMGEVLIPEGFKRSGSCYRRSTADGTVRWSIGMQKTRYPTDERGKFTFDVNAEWKHRPAHYEDWQPKATWYGGAGGRIGDLMPKKQDTWWEVETGMPINALCDEINIVLESHMIPFWKQFETEANIKAYLRAATSGSMKWNYPHALTMLSFDVQEKKEAAEIEKSVARARQLGKMYRVDKAVIEADIERVLKSGTI